MYEEILSPNAQLDAEWLAALESTKRAEQHAIERKLAQSANGAARMNRREASAIKEGLTQLLAELVRHIRAEARAELAALEARLLGEIERKGIDYRGTFRKGQAYARGSAVTFDGSLWIAVESYPRTPGEPNSGWKLACKRGRDAR
jgi:hypothetical protein